MKIIQINATAKIGSTGKIMCELDNFIKQSGNIGYMVCAYSSDNTFNNLYCVNKHLRDFQMKKNILFSRITGCMGYRYTLKTKEIIKWIDEKKPDIIHLHNIHGDWINLEVLFNYIKEKNIPVVWTIHDCWAFTGRCSHFELCGCEKWKTGCYNCNNNKVYPISYFFDFSRKMWSDKKEWFSGISNVSIITPSNWLSNYVKKSFLNKYHIETIHNGINVSTYHKVNVKSPYYKNIINKKIILGVSNMWTKLKGLDDFIKIDSMIDHEKYQIVLVGLNKKQLKQIPNTIIGISRTNNEKELVELYSGADVFVNPTYQDNYPTTNLEAQACGTPVITYDTGGSPESVLFNGIVVKKGNIDLLIEAIEKVCCIQSKDKTELELYAKKTFDKEILYRQYLNLYKNIYNEEISRNGGDII